MITSETQDIIDEMKEEASGNRGLFYENFGSGIAPVLSPLAELLNATQDEHPELVTAIARAMSRGY